MHLSLQLYTLRTPMESDPWATLSQVKEMGLDFVELAGTYGLEPAEVKAKLDELGLKISGSHVGLDDLENKMAEVVANHKTLGCKSIILPYVDPAYWKSNWKELQQKCESFGKTLQEHGFDFAYHNHGFEVEDKTLGPFFDTSDPELVGSQLDLGWIYFAGEDPVQWLNKYGTRTKSVHLKDMDMAPDTPDAIAGKGRLDWRSILIACEENGIEFGAIEMDNPPGDPVESVRECVEFFRARGVNG